MDRVGPETDRRAAGPDAGLQRIHSGPLLRVAQGSEITVDVTNNAGFEQTVARGGAAAPRWLSSEAEVPKNP